MIMSGMYSSATKLHSTLRSGEIRKIFLDYFIVGHEHKFVRSSPVVPFCDPTVAFVNAGMNQFKSVFLGNTEPAYSRVANSQKCVRVGGKHNDLSIVGNDGYHHTFFEMLGNWSFGDYFKREACEMALNLLRGPYNIHPKRLYVTYFGGDEILGLPADLECYEIWRSLGFPSGHILPFGTNHNFWEMGNTGPCGPCTEIHIDHIPDLSNSVDRSKLVNTGRPDLTELWNIVFIQYNRNEDGFITQLPSHHVDTGMGFERLTAILQNKSSNYDTDIFTPLFHTIQKISRVPEYIGNFASGNLDSVELDRNYRILADHARMITACLADGMLPDQNQKLCRVLRKAITICENTFGNKHLLTELIPVVADTLGPTYPEMYTKQNQVLEVIKHEQEVFKALRESSAKAFTEMLTEFPELEQIDLMECPGFVPAYRMFQSQKQNFTNNIIPGKFLYKLTDTHGLTEEHFLKLACIEGMTCDLNGYKNEIANAKKKAKHMVWQENNAVGNIMEEALGRLTATLPATDNITKYDYTYDISTKQYNIPTRTATVIGILYNGVSVMEAAAQCNSNDNMICVVTDCSNFYYESGGQQSDCGKMIASKADTQHVLEIVNVKFMNNCVVHMCKWPAGAQYFVLKINDKVDLEVNAELRKQNICHHTATHLLNAALRSLFQKVTYQVSSSVSNENCKLEVGLIGKRITKQDVEQLDALISRVICSSSAVNVETVNAADVFRQDDITMVPGEIYPETGLRLITINCNEFGFVSKELCCGTHVTNTQEIERFCITNLKQTNRARYAFTAVAGPAAELAFQNAALLKHRIDLLEQQLKTDKATNATEIELQKIRNNILHTNLVLPYAFKCDTLERIGSILKILRGSTRTTLKEFVEVEIKNLLQEKPFESFPFILHYISSSALMEEVPLQKATKMCTDRPILVISMCNRVLKARCCVPKKFVTNDFNAEKWLMQFAVIFNGEISPPKGKNKEELCNMKSKRVSTQFEEQIETAMKRAHDFATEQLFK